jgi:uncharacterized protein
VAFAEDAMKTLTLADLDTHYQPPKPTTLKKTLHHVDRWGRAYVQRSPFCVMSAAGPDGSLDVSPRGGEPGFVHVSEDGRRVFLPDRRGNNRLDTIRNLLAGSGQVGLMFLIPGFEDVYRVNGRACATTEPELLAEHEEFGRAPVLVLAIDVEEAFFHCPKAIMRARLWEEDAKVDRGVLPTLSEMIMDQLGLGKPTVSEDQIRESYKGQL